MYIYLVFTYMKSMVTLIRLFQDMTYIRKKRKVQDDKVLVSRKENYTPSLTLGTSIFKERKPFWKFWTHGKDIAILLDGCNHVLTLEKSEEKPSLNLQFGTKEETVRFISKVVAKSKADQKPITNFQFLIMAMLLGLIVVLQFMAMRGVKI